jgi:hypothetical protein
VWSTWTNCDDCFAARTRLVVSCSETMRPVCWPVTEAATLPTGVRAANSDAAQVVETARGFSCVGCECHDVSVTFHGPVGIGALVLRHAGPVARGFRSRGSARARNP